MSQEKKQKNMMVIAPTLEKNRLVGVRRRKFFNTPKPKTARNIKQVNWLKPTAWLQLILPPVNWKRWYIPKIRGETRILLVKRIWFVIGWVRMLQSCQKGK